jgi:Na+/proline symporter
LEGKTIDYVLISVFLIGTTAFGVISGGEQKTVKKYFRNSKQFPWWVSMFNIIELVVFFYVFGAILFVTFLIKPTDTTK